MGNFKKRRNDQRPNRPRQILRGLNIGEMSTVRRPAQEGAVATIVKGYKSEDEFDAWLEKQSGSYTGRRRRRRRDEDEEDIEKGGDLVRLVTSETDGHQHAIGVSCYDEDLSLYVHYAVSGESEMHSHDHSIVMNSDGTYSVTANAGHTHTLDQDAVRNAVFDMITKCDDVADLESVLPLVAKQDHARFAELIVKDGRFDKLPEKSALAALIKDHTASAIAPPSTGGTMDPKELQKKNEQLEKELAVTKALAGMTDVEKTHYNGLTEDDAKTAYLAKSSSDRITEAKDVIAKADADANKPDPVVYTTMKGREIRKSDGETVLALAKDADDSMREVAKERATNEKARIEKRAKDEFAGLPGDDATHVAVARALETIKDAELQKKAFEMIKAKAPDLAAAGRSSGSSATPMRVVGKNASQTEAEDELDRLAKERMKEVAKSGDGKSIDFYAAYEQVSNENPELLEKAIGQTTETRTHAG